MPAAAERRIGWGAKSEKPAHGGTFGPMADAPRAHSATPGASSTPRGKVRPHAVVPTMLTEPRPKSADATLLGSLENVAAEEAAPLSARQRHLPSSLNPALAAAFSLRHYSLGRGRIDPERPQSQRTKHLPLEYIDLLGGNGRWRQRKAEREWERRRLEEEERRRLEKLEEEERRRRRLELEERRRKQKEDEERRRQEERARQLREAEERERRRLEQEERERLAREAAEREWLARQPRTCETCVGSGRCVSCEGRGCSFAMFLVPAVAEGESQTTYGRHFQGCPTCGGYKQGILGELRKGSGRCQSCGGAGKIAPKLADITPVRHRGHAPGEPASPNALPQVDSPGAVDKSS